MQSFSTRAHAPLLPALLVAALAGPALAVAQRVPVLPATTVRFELGLRLRALETELESVRGQTEAIERAMPFVDESVRAFFALSFAGAAERLDAARSALQTAVEIERSHARLAFVPAKRLVDAEHVRMLAIEHGWVYAPGRDEEDRFGMPGLRYRIEHRLVDPAGALVAGPVVRTFTDLRPASLELPLPEIADDEDLVLESTTTPVDGDGEAAEFAPAITRRSAVSLVRDLASRCEALEGVEQRARASGSSTAAATVAHYARMLRTLAKGRALETDVPAAALLSEAEAIARHLDEGAGPYFAGVRTGERWWIHLAVPRDDDGAEQIVPIRLWTPPFREAGERAPLVVALHGAGGSENMFFDGYGDGLACRLAAERGWAFVAPRTQTASTTLVAMVDELARRYPIDSDRVVLLGHSMGAAKVVDLLQVAPGRFSAAAPMGGGGRVRRGAALDELPVFVGCGSRDFALDGARALHRKLERSGAQASLRIYEGIEHLTIVQIALPDVYAFFDDVLGG